MLFCFYGMAGCSGKGYGRMAEPDNIVFKKDTQYVENSVPQMVSKIAAAQIFEQVSQLFSPARDHLVVASKNRATDELELLLRKRGFEVKHYGKNNILRIDVFSQGNQEYVVSSLRGNYGRQTRMFLFQNKSLLPTGPTYVGIKQF